MAAELNSALDEDGEGVQIVQESLENPYHMATVDEKNRVYLNDWIPKHADDPAVKVNS